MSVSKSTYVYVSSGPVNNNNNRYSVQCITCIKSWNEY